MLPSARTRGALAKFSSEINDVRNLHKFYICINSQSILLYIFLH
jgi:hypothetical protein